MTKRTMYNGRRGAGASEVVRILVQPVFTGSLFYLPGSRPYARSNPKVTDETVERRPL